MKGRMPPGVRSRMVTAREKLRIIRDSLSDANYFARHAAPTEGAFGASRDLKHIEAQITKDYHRVEKAFSLPETKQPFGSDLERRLSKGIAVAEDGGPRMHAASALNALRLWNGSAVFPQHLLKQERNPSTQDLTFEELASSRGSVRNFDPSRVVEIKHIEHSVEIASTTPSVCNRRPWSAHLYNNEPMHQLLRLQGGNSGFTSTIPNLILVTVDSRLFAGSHERYQPWIDGGLFSMNLVWALQAKGIATCFLNWSKRPQDTEQLRSVAHISPYDLPIVMIAVGYPRDGFRMTRSPLRSENDVLRDHRLPSK